MKIDWFVHPASTRIILREEVINLRVLFRTLEDYFQNENILMEPLEYIREVWTSEREWDSEVPVIYVPVKKKPARPKASVIVNQTDTLKIEITLEGVLFSATVTKQELQDSKRVAIEWIEDILVRCDHEMSVGKETDRWERIINRINYQ